jgi:hypothetical protein
MCRYNRNIRQLEHDASSGYGKPEGTMVIAAEMGQVGGLDIQPNVLPPLPWASALIGAEWPGLGRDDGPFPTATSPKHDVLTPFPPPWDGDLASPCFGAVSLGYTSLEPFDPSHAAVLYNSPAVSAATGSPGSPVSASPDASTRSSEAGGPEQDQVRTQTTTLTMQNLDSGTRNEILDILCKRRISTTIDTS